MPKVRPKDLSVKYSEYLKEEKFSAFSLNEKSIDNKTLFCETCSKDIKCVKKYDLEQHILRVSHIESQKNYRNINLTQNDFNKELCRLCAETIIPFNKINDPLFKNFIEKFTQFKCPEESNLRKYVLPSIYSEKIEEIKNELKDDYIWLSVDETTDTMGRHVCNVLVGPLNQNKPNKSYLLNTEFIPKTNNLTILLSIMTALSILWPEGIKYDKLLLFLTDAATYMKLTAEKLKEIFPKVIHLTCLCHGLNNVCDFISKKHPNVNKLISLGKAVFRKCDSRKELFGASCTGLPLPPNPIRTRWSTWLLAAEYYDKNYIKFKETVQSMNSVKSQNLKELHELLKNDSNIIEELRFIAKNFMNLTKIIKQLETENLLLSESIGKIGTIESELKCIEENYEFPVFQELERVLNKNTGFRIIKQISNIVSGLRSEQFTGNLVIDEIMSFIRAPITTCANERSFSKYNLILTERRHMLSDLTIKYLLILNFNKNNF